jgi:hypothetical protein
MPRYVILEHDHPIRHWDFMLEAGDVLRTWRLEAPPSPGQAVRAEASFDHRPLYLDYEGPVSRGRGSVARWDAGIFTWTVNAEDRVVARLEGGRLSGTAVLERAASGAWLLRIVPEEPLAAG